MSAPTPRTKGEMRKLRKAARAAGAPMPDAHRDDATDAMAFSETARGYRARERWARRYDALNGAPEGDWDR